MPSLLDSELTQKNEQIAMLNADLRRYEDRIIELRLSWSRFRQENTELRRQLNICEEREQTRGADHQPSGELNANR